MAFEIFSITKIIREMKNKIKIIAAVFFVALTLQVSAQNTSKSFDVYPNPASTWVTIDYESNSSYSISIQNLLGSELYKAENNSFQSKTIVDIAELNLQSGMYLVKIIENGVTIKRERLIIKRI